MPTPDGERSPGIRRPRHERLHRPGPPGLGRPAGRVQELTAITFAELHQGVATAKDATIRAARTEKLAAAIVEFEPLSFDGPAAARYGTLVALTIQVNRDPKPRRLDIMIAAVASALGLPLHTRNAKDLGGLADMLDVRQV